ncbi:hypothetical protein L4C39_19725 [Vibrio clamense]|uniref:hypothetical protein n=1 Tax=Vibrio clamense TaxID=2910254 RepID=UPI003D22E1AB
MFKKAEEEASAFVSIMKKVSSLGNGPFWKRGFIYVFWWALIVAFAVGTPLYLQNASEKHSEEYLNKTGDIGNHNRMLIAKDSLELCIASIKNSHKYEERYCKYAIKMFEKHSSRIDEFLVELVEAKAYEQMIVSIDSDIRGLDYEALVKRHGVSWHNKALDLIFSPLGTAIYLTFFMFLLFLPLIAFNLGRKLNQE